MDDPSRFGRGLVRVAPPVRRRLTGTLSLLVGVAACRAAPPTPYGRGALVPLGVGGLRVSHVERVAGSYFSRHGLQVRADWDAMAVFLKVEGPRVPAVDTLVATLMFSTRLQDSTGRRFGPPLPLHVDMYRMMMTDGESAFRRGDLELMMSRAQADGPIPRDWVAVFPVAPEARGFHLLVRNPSVRKGQPRAAAVDLGR